MPETVRRNVAASKILAWRDGELRPRTDRLAGEEPMEIRVGGPGKEASAVAVTMRTPGHDFELAAGFLFTEGLMGPHDVERISYCEDAGAEQQLNVVTVRTRAAGVSPEPRNFYATSSCGVCGKASLDQVEVLCSAVGRGPKVAASAIVAMPESLRQRQSLFDVTGGLHAAGLFAPDGTTVVVREDVGRHNAVDKLIGHVLLRGEVPAGERVLVVSGRASFEIVQKAAVAGIPVLCAVSAPSSLALEAARRFDMTLVGFVRDGGFNVYCGEERIDLPTPSDTAP